MSAQDEAGLSSDSPSELGWGCPVGWGDGIDVWETYLVGGSSADGTGVVEAVGIRVEADCSLLSSCRNCCLS